MFILEVITKIKTVKTLPQRMLFHRDEAKFRNKIAEN